MYDNTSSLSYPRKNLDLEQMVKKQEFDNVVMGGIALMGLILFSIAATSFKNIHKSCVDKLIRDGWTVILVLGACLTTAGVSFFLCTRSEGAKCYNAESRTIRLFLMMCIALSLMILIISSMMLSKYKKKVIEANCDNKGANKRSAGIVVGVSTLSLLGCIAALVKGYLDNK
jgi:hypothetical protein